jgi:G3E family GTPase
MSKKINLYLLSGFLGAGKTTFLKKALEEITNEKVGVIMNEFGKIGIDGPIIEKDGMELVEINRGSIFCSCLKLSFIQAMMEMAERDMKYLFVESSGLADPSNIGDVLKGVESAKGDVYDFKGAICLIDALHFLEQIDDLETVERQLKHCHLAIINKIDLVDKDTLIKIEEKVKDINPIVEIRETSYGNIDFDFLNEDLMKNGWVESEETTNTKDNKPKTLNMTFNEVINKEDLTKFLDIISKECYRIKGFVKLNDGWNQVDVVNRKIDYKLIDEEKETSQLVFISKTGPNVIRPIFNNWEEIIGQEMKLR